MSADPTRGHRPATEYATATGEVKDIHIPGAKSKAKPTKLKPLGGKRKGGKVRDHTEEMAADDDMEKLLSQAARNDDLARLDEDMAAILNVASGGDNNLQLLNDAFEGKSKASENVEVTYDETTGDVKVKRVTKKPAQRAHSNDPRKAKTALTRDAAGLAPILEDHRRDGGRDGMSTALVPVNNEQKRKARNEMLKMRARAMSKPNRQGRVIFDADLGQENTFVTGGGLPGRRKGRGGEDSDGEQEPFYLYEEEALLAKVEGYERDM